MELWRTDYKKDAYVDQTGKQQEGKVVYERVVVTQIASEDQFEGYGQELYADTNPICITEDGRMFYGSRNLVDYHGGTHWREVKPQTPLSDTEKDEARKEFWVTGGAFNSYDIKNGKVKDYSKERITLTKKDLTLTASEKYSKWSKLIRKEWETISCEVGSWQAPPNEYVGWGGYVDLNGLPLKDINEENIVDGVLVEPVGKRVATDELNF